MARGRSKGGGDNRSLQRGIEILRAFRAGVDVLGNGELAERTGLPRATVSRLTRTLVNSGMLDDVPGQRAYRLAASVMSFGHAMRVGSPVLKVLAPLMRVESMKRKLNVGLAAADRTMMVYLESIRFNPRVALRNVVAGQQVPMELTSLGRAYLAALPENERAVLLAKFVRRSNTATRALRADIQSSIRCVKRQGYCAVSWQPGVLSVATPLIVQGMPVYAVNMSAQNVDPTAAFAREMGAYLLAFAANCNAALMDS